MYTNTKGLDLVFNTDAYAVAVNNLARKETRKRNKDGVVLELSEPNYLVINLTTNAVEFSADQLPAAIEAAKHFTRAIENLVQVEKQAIPDEGSGLRLVKPN